MEVLFEDNHLIAINKLVADIVQVDKTGDFSLEEKVKQYIKTKYKKPGDAFLGVVHRIDRPVSGIVLFARTSKALSRLNQMFQDKEIKKTYWAIVKEKPPKDSDTLRHYLVRNTSKNKAFAYDRETKDSKLAILAYKLLDNSENYFLLEIDLQTGRHHQIRCQLAKIGCPVRGDLKYGYPRSLDDGGINLHSRSMEFEHPVTHQPVKILADPPEDKLWNFFKERNK
jgi:23S rRNA pseudouridine1911/1915/1917 synthase